MFAETEEERRGGDEEEEVVEEVGEEERESSMLPVLAWRGREGRLSVVCGEVEREGRVGCWWFEGMVSDGGGGWFSLGCWYYAPC